MKPHWKPLEDGTNRNRATNPAHKLGLAQAHCRIEVLPVPLCWPLFCEIKSHACCPSKALSPFYLLMLTSCEAGAVSREDQNRPSRAGCARSFTASSEPQPRPEIAPLIVQSLITANGFSTPPLF